MPARVSLPLFIFDTGYNSVALAEGLKELLLAILVMLRCDRCFYDHRFDVEHTIRFFK